jgi:ubiquitin carboxyl-terminal hydrolase 5/13
MDLIDTLASKCRPASVYDQVLNSECAYTFHSPFTTDKGIVVNLETYVGTVEDLAFANSNTNDKEGLFVRIVKKRVPSDNTNDTTTTDAETTPTPPTKLGIGVQGGFLSDEDKWTIMTTYSVVVLKSSSGKGGGAGVVVVVVTEIPYNDSSEKTTSVFSESLVQLVDSVILHAGMTTQQDVKAWQLDTNESIAVSKYAADLPFVDNGIMIDPNNAAEWKCQKSGDTQNLWLNLSDGYIGGGRKNWDGSGGSNGALDHYEETGCQYPLAVKLGTITADLDTADCYSYAKDEDGPVKVPNLAQLLEKRGIQVAIMQVYHPTFARSLASSQTIGILLCWIVLCVCLCLSLFVSSLFVWHATDSLSRSPCMCPPSIRQAKDGQINGRIGSRIELQL